LKRSRRFGGTESLYLQGRWVSQLESKLPTACWYIFVLIWFLMMETICPSETPDSLQTTRSHNPENYMLDRLVLSVKALPRPVMQVSLTIRYVSSRCLADEMQRVEVRVTITHSLFYCCGLELLWMWQCNGVQGWVDRSVGE
jgi:hypothetical protein